MWSVKIRARWQAAQRDFTIAPECRQESPGGAQLTTRWEETTWASSAAGWKLQPLRTMPVAAEVLLGDSKQPRGKGGHLFFTCFLQANGSSRLQI
jgi:hypothetical protein